MAVSERVGSLGDDLLGRRVLHRDRRPIVDQGVILTLEGPFRKVMSVAFSTDGTQVLAGSGDRTLRLWDATTGRLVRTYKGHMGAVYSVAFSPDGMRLLSCSRDKTLKLCRDWQIDPYVYWAYGRSTDSSILARREALGLARRRQDSV